MDKNGQRVACKNWNAKDKTILSFSGSPTVALARLLLESTPGVQCSKTLLRSSPTLQTLQTLQTLPPPPRPFASVRFDPLAWSSGSDQRRISGCGFRWLLAGPDSLPLWLCRVCAFVLLRCFSCSHTVLPKEHSLGVIFFSSLSSCKFCIFLQFYLHFTTDYTCMIVYVMNNKEPWTLNWCEKCIDLIWLVFVFSFILYYLYLYLLILLCSNSIVFCNRSELMIFTKLCSW